MSSGNIHHTTEAFASAVCFGLFFAYCFICNINYDMIVGVSCVIPSHNQQLQLMFLWHVPAIFNRRLVV